jgi:hypothetical protein
MKRFALFVPVVLMFACSADVPGGTMPGSVSRDSLVDATPLETISVGLAYDNVIRGLSFDSGDTAKLEAQVYSFILGCDVAKWCTIFCTLGKADGKLEDAQEEGKGQFKWSIGLNASLWQVDMEQPRLFNGRISIKPVIEYSHYASSVGDDEIRWNDFSGSLFLCYQKTIEDPAYNPTEFFGFAVYLGPAFSIINGYTVPRTGTTDFSQDQSIGIVAGLDFFISSNFSVGGQVQSFDEVSAGGNIRYHF